MSMYEAAFGEKAAMAFTKAIRAWHADILVVTEQQPKTEAAIHESARESNATENNAAAESGEGFHAKRIRAKDRRVIARLPMPRPLAAAVAAGTFGQDESGPVMPSADEVREITENHAEILVDLLSDLKRAEQNGSEADRARISAELQTAVTKYAEDFGERAAEQLLAYCRRQNLINDASWNAPAYRQR